MRTTTLAAVIGLMVLAVPGPALADGVDPAAVGRLVNDFAGRAGYPGIAVAITRGDRVVHLGAYGTGVSTTTAMPIASVSKSFTALAVMQLADAGRVSLDAPVHDYLPGFRVADPRGARITVRDLLDHTSGITDRTLPEKSLPQPASPAAAVVRARSATLASDPGTTYAYTNTNFHLAARLVEVVAGQPFGEYLRTHVFEPAGMRATTSVSHTPAPGYKGHIYAYGLSIPAAEPRRFVEGSDGVITTARDMARWLIVQHGGTGLVSARGLTAMHTATGGDSTYALGWDTEKDGRIRHNGVWFTATASALLLPSGYGIAVLGDSGIGLGNEGTDQLADALATLVTGGHPAGFPPIRATVDAVLAALTALSLALGLRNLRRTRAWAARTGRRAAAWRLPFRLIPLALLLALPDLLGLLVGGGRDITFGQLCFYSPSLVAWAATAAILNATVLATRAAALRGSVGAHV